MQDITKPTEMTPSIDAVARQDALSAMLASHMDAVAIVSTAQNNIDTAAGYVARALAAGKTLHYAAAGSSALMALADSCELPGTFGIAAQQIRICMAGGVPADGVMPGYVEDDAADAVAAAQGMALGDVAIVVSASGTTPYSIAFAQTVKEQGNKVIAVANVSGSQLLEMADVGIALPTAPEVVGGSTRLGAGTAQKVALNMISTQAGILLGHVHDGFMVNFAPDNVKLRKRAAQIVMKIVGVSEAAADAALMQCGYDTKLAVLIAAGIDIDDARIRLEKAGGRLRDCLPDQDYQTNTNG